MAFQEDPRNRNGRDNRKLDCTSLPQFESIALSENSVSTRSSLSSTYSSSGGLRGDCSFRDRTRGNKADHLLNSVSALKPRRIWHAFPQWSLEFESLTRIQQLVMERVAASAETQSTLAKERLKKAWRHLNVLEKDFSAIEVYLAKKVPLTIRVDIRGLFPYLIHDPFYR